MSLQPRFPPFGFLCPTTQLAVSGEGTSRNYFEITGEGRPRVMWIYTMEQEHGAVLPQKQVESHQLSQPCLVSHHCSQFRPQNGTSSCQETNMCKAKAGNVCHTSFSPCRHDFIVSTQFCYPGAVGYFLQSHLLPPTQIFSLIYQATMVSVELCQSW